MNEPVIEGYSDLEVIGRGGFAVVYRARREALDQDVAVKVLSLPDLTERDLERFTRECRAAGNLAWHPHVVAVYDSGTTTGGQPYLAMEHLDNGTLADRLHRDGPLPWQDVIDIGIQIAGALGAAHAAGTLHRDMKPENILVGHFGEALLADFGIAAVEGHTRTATGHAAFTVTHVAPEILKGQRPDERTDLYGLASTLHTLLTGTTPFATGDPDEPVATVITRVLTEPAPHLTGIPEPLADLLDQALDKDPDARPQTAAEFGEALQQIQRDNDLPVTTLRLTRTPRTTTPTEAETPDDPTPTGDDLNATIHLTPETTPATDPNATITLTPTEPAPHATAEPQTAAADLTAAATPQNPPVEPVRAARPSLPVSTAPVLGFTGVVLLAVSLPLTWYTVFVGDELFERPTDGVESISLVLVPWRITLPILCVAALLVIIGTARNQLRLRGITLVLLGLYTLSQAIGAVWSSQQFSSSVGVSLGVGVMVAFLAGAMMSAAGILDLRRPGSHAPD